MLKRAVPKIVDHDARRTELATALWRVVLRDGIEHASVRTVAAEAGWSAGALRHYFATQDELLAFAMNLVAERIRARAYGLPDVGTPCDRVLTILEQMLPMDAERRAETAVWFVFTARAQADRSLRRLRSRFDGELAEAIRSLVEQMVEVGLVRSTVDIGVETDRLRALVDGLALHGLTHPGTMTAERMRRTLAAHLDSLAP